MKNRDNNSKHTLRENQRNDMYGEINVYLHVLLWRLQHSDRNCKKVGELLEKCQKRGQDTVAICQGRHHVLEKYRESVWILPGCKRCASISIVQSWS